MRFRKALLAAICGILLSPLAHGQESQVDTRPRLVFDAAIGDRTWLGYRFPSLDIGPSLEIPIGAQTELQARASYSPDHKAITGDGHSALFGGSVVRFANRRIGFVASVDHTSLWTSQFDKRVWQPYAGVVIRNNYWGPGRMYVTYLFPTGCVWATASNPCQIQSNRLQGLQVRQDARKGTYGRWAYETGVYRFCDQANPYQPQTGRKCHWAGVVMLRIGLEFHLGRFARTPANRLASDNF